MKKGLIPVFILAAMLVIGLINQPAQAHGAVAGRVIDADGDPVEGAVVTIRTAMRVRGERPFRARVETNEQGIFGFRQVPRGRYHVQAVARGLGGARARVGVRDDQVARVQLQLHGRGGRGDREDVGRGTVGVIVVDSDGEAVEGAIVLLVREADRRRGRALRHRGVRGRTDENGVCVFENVPEGNYRVMAGARRVGRARGEVEVVADEAVRVRLELVGRG